MTTAVLEKKASRIDLRMTEEQKRQIETAAQISGMSVSQWSMDRLMESSRDVIAQQKVTRLAQEAFDEFARLLDEPTSPDFARFMGEKTRWER